MPYNCHQNVSPYYNSKLSVSSSSTLVNNGNSFRKTNVSSSPQQQQHREKHAKLIPRSFSMSQVSSTSWPLYSSAMTASNKAAGLLSDASFGHSDHDDMQPLDLSMRAHREEHTGQQSTADERKPICMVKSCMCSTLPQHLSPHSITGQAVTLSPPPGMTLSSFNRADSPVYTQHQMPSSTYHASSSKATLSPSSTYHASSSKATLSPSSTYYASSSKAMLSPSSTYHASSSKAASSPSSTYHASSSQAASSPSAVPHTSPWNTTPVSPFQLLVATDKVLNGAHNSSGLFRPYDDHLQQDMNVSMCEEAEQESAAASSKPDDYDDESDELTYMDLDSTTAVPLAAKTKKNYTANSGFVYGRLNSLPTSSVHHRNTEGKTEAVTSLHQSPLLQALNSKKAHGFSDKRAAAYFHGGVISHTSFEKSRKKIIGHTSIIPNSEQAAHPKHPQQQLHLPDSSTSPTSLPASTGHVNLYSSHTHPTTTGQYQDNHGHTGMLRHDYPAYSPTSMSSQHLPSSTNQMHLVQSGSKRPIDQDSGAGSETDRSTPHKTTSNVQLPVSTSRTSDGVSGHKHKRTGDRSDDSLQQGTSEKEGNNSTKISLLDFWISKILMERSIEASQPRKPCNVDYICTPNGEKRIRLRLVDLMEMQVEQSMKA